MQQRYEPIWNVQNKSWTYLLNVGLQLRNGSLDKFRLVLVDLAEWFDSNHAFRLQGTLAIDYCENCSSLPRVQRAPRSTRGRYQSLS